MRTECGEIELGSPLESQIGNTPLVRLDRVVRAPPGITLLGNAEWHNPGGSVKDRPAVAMVRKSIAAGRLGPGKTLLDATSGNTGIALAILCDIVLSASRRNFRSACHAVECFT